MSWPADRFPADQLGHMGFFRVLRLFSRHSLLPSVQQNATVLSSKRYTKKKERKPSLRLRQIRWAFFPRARLWEPQTERVIPAFLRQTVQCGLHAASFSHFPSFSLHLSTRWNLILMNFGLPHWSARHEATNLSVRSKQKTRTLWKWCSCVLLGVNIRLSLSFKIYTIFVLHFPFALPHRLNSLPPGVSPNREGFQRTRRSRAWCSNSVTDSSERWRQRSKS